jgi:hypothetical protein
LPEHLVNSVANEARHTHVIYKRASKKASSPRDGRIPYCSSDASIAPSYNATLPNTLINTKLREDVDENQALHIVEGILVTDSGLYQKHGRDPSQLTRYVLTLMNIVRPNMSTNSYTRSNRIFVVQASSMYNSYLLGINMRLVLTRIYMFTDKMVYEV